MPRNAQVDVRVNAHLCVGASVQPTRERALRAHVSIPQVDTLACSARLFQLFCTQILVLEKIYFFKITQIIDQTFHPQLSNLNNNENKSLLVGI